MNVKFQSFSRARVNKLWHGIKSALFLSKVLLKHHHTHLVGTVKGSFHSAVAKFSSCRPTEPQIFTIWPFNNSNKKKKTKKTNFLSQLNSQNDTVILNIHYFLSLCKTSFHSHAEYYKTENMQAIK